MYISKKKKNKETAVATRGVFKEQSAVHGAKEALFKMNVSPHPGKWADTRILCQRILRDHPIQFYLIKDEKDRLGWGFCPIQDFND